MNRSHVRCSLIAIATALPPACVGDGWTGSRTTTYDTLADSEWPDLREDAHTPRERRGEPDERIIHSDSEEEWRYVDDGLRWGGLVLFVIIPIPLAVPIGHEHDVFDREQGVVRSVRHLRMSWPASACGLLGHHWDCDSVGEHE